MNIPNQTYAHFARQYRKALRRISAAIQPDSDICFTSARVDKLLQRLNKFARILRRPYKHKEGSALALAARTGTALLLCTGVMQAQAPKVQDIAPATNSHVALSSSNIVITFSTQMTAASLTAGNINIRGQHSGYLSTKGTFSGNPTVSFNPNQNLRAGELITISVTGAQTIGGTSLTRAQVFQFKAGVSGGTGQFALKTVGLTAATTISQDAALGDLDGDGDLDILVAARDASNEIWLNNGNNTFASSTFGLTNGKSDGVVLGDLDNDGDLDAAFANSSQANEIWLNNGDGTFTSSLYGSGNSQALAIGDLDGDGDSDIILANFNSKQHIWLNNGDASFTSSAFGGNDDSYGINLGDLDNDGDLDVVVANYREAQRVWLNNGNATFSSMTVGHSSGMNYDVAIGDLDNDGDLDAIIAGRAQSELWLNNGDASFASSRFGPSIWGNGVALGDLDNDLDLDAVLSNLSGKQTIWTNNGDGTFTTSDFGSGSSNGAEIGDLDSDGDLDVVIVNYFSEQEVWVNKPHIPNSPFTPRVDAISPATHSHVAARNSDIEVSFTQPMTTSSLTAGNIIIYGSQSGYISTRGTFSGSQLRRFNPDAKLKAGELVSVMVTGATSIGGTTMTRSVIQQFRIGVEGGSANFTAHNFGTGNSQGLAFGDLDNDGDLDAIIANYSQAQHILLNNGDGTFTSTTFGGGKSLMVKIADLDNDGDLDAIVSNNDEPKEIWLNNGDATFTSSSFGYGAAGNYGMALGDLDNDGDIDAIFTGFNRQEELWLNNGDATFSSVLFGPSGGGDNASRGIDLGDIDNDGDLDAIVANDNWKAQYIYLNNGDATFSLSTLGNFRSLDVAIGDLDGDGDLDAIISNYNQASKLWTNNGDGTFVVTDFNSFGSRWAGVELADFDNDGDLDALFANNNGRNSLYLNDGSGGFMFQTNFASASSDLSAGLAIGDLDGDGDLDAMFANRNDSQRIWLNQPIAPTVVSLSPNVTTASLSALSLSVRGTDFEMTTAQISKLDAQGIAAGLQNLTPINATRAQFSTIVPAGLLATVGTLTLTIGNQSGTTSTTLTIMNDRPTISTLNSLVQLNEDSSTVLTLALGDVWPGLGSLTVSSTTADHLTIASIAQLGGTAATTQFLVTPVADANGLATISFTVDDGELQASTSISLQVIPVNDPPVLAATQDLTAFGNSSTMLTLSLADKDTPFGGLSLSATSANQALIPDSNLVIGATQANTLLKITPLCDVFGTSDLTITVSDGEFTRSTTLLLTIVPGAALNITGANCACPNTILHYEALPLNTSTTHSWSLQGGTIIGSQTGASVNVVWDLNASSASLQVSRTSQSGCTSAAGLNTSVKSILAIADHAQVSGTSSTIISVLANDSGNGLVVSTAGTPAHGTLQLNTTTVTYTADPSFSGSDTFTYIAENSNGCTSAALVNIFVQSGLNPMVNLEYVERQKDRVGGVRGLRSAHSAALSPDGANLYVAGRRDHSIVRFSRDSTDGTLNYTGRERHGHHGVSGLKYVSDVIVSPDGTRLYAAGYGDNAIAVFNRKRTNGLLSFVERKKRGQLDNGRSITGLKQPRRLGISPDGRSILATGYADHSLVLFRFDPLLGTLTFAECHKDGSNGVNGLKQALGLTFSPDGRHVYVAGAGDNAVAVFAHDLRTGSLSFVEHLRNNINGVIGLGTVSDLAVSPDGRQVYAASSGNDAVTVFKRNSLNGRLSFIATYQDGVAAVSGIQDANSVTVSPDGKQVWVAGKAQNAVAVFKRNPVDGTLEFNDKAVDGLEGFDGLSGVTMVALSPHAEYAYAPGANENSLAVLFRNRFPVANDDYAGAINKNSTSTILPLLNDSDADNHQLEISAVNNALLGTVNITGGGTGLEYTAGAITGSDQFTYTVIDAHGGSSSATVQIMVTQLKSSALENFSAPVSNSALTVSPNPAHKQATIKFSLSERADVLLTLTDLNGNTRLTVNLADLPTGQHSRTIVLKEFSGAALPAGMYFVELEFVHANGSSNSISEQLVIQ